MCNQYISYSDQSNATAHNHCQEMRGGASIVEQLCSLRPRGKHSCLAAAASAEELIESLSGNHVHLRVNGDRLSEVGRESMPGFMHGAQPMQRHAGAWPLGRGFSTTAAAASNAPKLQQVEAALGGKSLVLECGELAMLADGACVARQGATSVLVTVVGGTEAEEGGDFLPLQVRPATGT